MTYVLVKVGSASPGCRVRTKMAMRKGLRLWIVIDARGHPRFGSIRKDWPTRNISIRDVLHEFGPEMPSWHEVKRVRDGLPVRKK